MRTAPVFDQDGKVKGGVGIVEDITGRKRAEEALRHSEELVRSIVDTVDVGFLVIDQDLRILMANKTYCRWVSTSCEDVIGKHCHEITHRALKPCYEEGERCAVRQAFQTGLPQTVEHTHEDAEGQIMYVGIKAYPLKDHLDKTGSVIVTINNLTKQRLLEEQQLNTQKLEAIGTLAGGIAHDFNNLLQGLFGYISMAKERIDDREKAISMLAQAEKALHLSVNLTSQLLTFAKGGKPVKKMVAIRPLIENSVKLALSGSRCDFRLGIEEGLWPVEADEGQVSQVIQNIVLNAEQAMPSGGTVTITARNVNVCTESLPLLLSNERCVEIAISDTGIGIPEEHRSKIFDPYFTTKQKGSGLGLSTSYSIIRNHRGLITIDSELNRGSTFHIFLPATEGEVRANVSPELPRISQKAKILVMDDEDVVRNVLREMLSGLGHEVDLAEDGAVAVEKYRKAMESGCPFDVVILDITVRGGMGGELTIRKLKDLDPEVKAVVSSGYSDSVVISEYASYGFKAFLSKPFNLRELTTTLNTIFDNSKDTPQ